MATVRMGSQGLEYFDLEAWCGCLDRTVGGNGLSCWQQAELLATVGDVHGADLGWLILVDLD